MSTLPVKRSGDRKPRWSFEAALQCERLSRNSVLTSLTRDQLTDALDRAFTVYFQHLFEVLMSSPIEDAAALDRFHNGLDKALERHRQVKEMIEDEEK